MVSSFYNSIYLIELFVVSGNMKDTYQIWLRLFEFSKPKINDPIRLMNSLAHM
jgi:hypothetical protein